MMTGKKVMIVSKDPVLLEFLRCNLSQDKYHLMATQDMNEDIESVLAEITPCLVILDIMMPRMGGIEMSLYIRQQSQVPILMLSTWGAGKDKVRALDVSNTDDYLSEPFGIAEVTTRIERALRCSRVYKN